MKKDWFRQTAWGRKNSEEFFARLARARGDANKAQYLRVQGYTLLETGTRRNARAAIELFDLLLKEYPQQLELAPAHCGKGDCFRLLGNWQDAVECYRAALEQQRVFPNVRTTADLSFAWVVMQRRLSDMYEDALRWLDEFRATFTFPNEQFKACASKAVIFSRLGRHSEASESARLAVEAVGKRHSGFAKHPRLGLVDRSNLNLVLWWRLKRMAAR